MPTIRVLADGTRTVSGNAVVEPDESVTVECGAGDALLTRMDYTGWLGEETLSGVTWEALDAAGATAEATSGGFASAQIGIPDSSAGDALLCGAAHYRFRVTATSSGGRKHVSRIGFTARAR